MTRILLFIAILGFSTGLQAGEADHFTDSNKSLQDISTVLNERANEMLQAAVSKTNSDGKCGNSKEQEAVLYKNLRPYFNNHSKGKLVKEILHGEDIPSRKIPLKQSIYGKWSVWNGYLLGKKSAATSALALSPMINIGGQVVGTDKLEHMFGMGYFYFKGHYLKGKKIRKVLKKGIFKEKTILGGNFAATGVFSYADLSANFNGMRFWNHILLRRDDILGKKHNLGPYVSCENEEWKVVQDIDFRDYVDASMDESINCNKLATRKGLKKYKKSMERLNASCPMDFHSLANILEKYNVTTPKDKKKRPLSHWILNREGVGRVSYLNEF